MTLVIYNRTLRKWSETSSQNRTILNRNIKVQKRRNLFFSSGPTYFFRLLRCTRMISKTLYKKRSLSNLVYQILRSVLWQSISLVINYSIDLWNKRIVELFQFSAIKSYENSNRRTTAVYRWSYDKRVFLM